MKLSKRHKAFISGVGSVFAFLPSDSYAQHVPSSSAEERMRSYWEDTGMHLREAMGQYDEEQQEQKPSK